MSNTPSENLPIFNQNTRTAFLQHLRERPNNRHVSQAGREILIEWLTDPKKRPTSQKEFSRRNYVLKTFTWDEKTQSLFATAKTDEAKLRTVITEDSIIDTVELVHKSNGHAGWDTTWKDVSSSYYGILRSDVIFLLRQCQECVLNPAKRPKGSVAAAINPDHDFVGFLGTGDLYNHKSAWDILEEGAHSGEECQWMN